MKYNNLHSFLDAQFATIEVVTDVMIQKAKQEYRKQYLAHYQKQYQHKYVQVSFRISKNNYNAFEVLAKQKDIKVSTLIKQTVLSKKDTLSSFNTEPLMLLALRSIDVVEEAINENESVDTSILIPLLEEILTLLK